MLLYVDTNIIMDFLLNRDSSAYKVLMDGYQCKHTFIISKLVLDELAYQQVQADSFIALSIQTNKLSIKNVEGRHTKFAQKQQYTHFNDAIHAGLAIEHTNGNVLTKNIKDFKEIPGIQAIHPDNI